MKADAASPSRSSAGWALALGAAGLGLFGAAWVFRLPLAGAAGEAYLRGRGVEASLSVRALSLTGLRLSQVRLGPGAAPDLTVEDFQASWRWVRPFVPALDEVVLKRPALTASWGEDGLSFGQLENLFPVGGADAGAPPQPPPAIAVLIQDGVLTLETPAGALSAAVEASGRLADTFTLEAPWRFTAANEGALGGVGALSVRSTRSGYRAALRGTGRGAAPGGLGRVQGARIEVSASASPSLEDLDGLFAAEIEALEQGDWRLASMQAEGRFTAPNTALGAWRARASMRIAGAQGGTLTAGPLRLMLTAARQSAQVAGGASAYVESVSDGWGEARGLVAGGPFSVAAMEPLSARADLSVRAGRLSVAPGLRAPALETLASLQNTPLAPLAAAATPTLRAALSDAALHGRFALSFEGDAASLALPEPMIVSAPRGVSARLSAAAPWRAGLKDGSLEGAGLLEVEGRGAPTLTLELAKLARGPNGAVSLEASAAARWRAPGAALELEGVQLQMETPATGAAQASLSGALRFSGQGGGLRVEGLEAPLALEASFGEGLRIAAPEPLVWRVRRLAGEGFDLDAMRLELRQTGGALLSETPEGARSGGARLTVSPITGVIGGERTEATLRPLDWRWRGSGPRAGALTAPALQIAQESGLAADVGPLTASIALEPAFSARGTITGGAAGGGPLPVQASDLRFDWALDEQGAALRAGGLTVTDVESPARFNTLRLENLEARLSGETLRAEGEVALAAPAQRLAGFSLAHDLASGAGALEVPRTEIAFSPEFQPYDLSPALVGVVDIARGGVALSGHAAWRAKEPPEATGAVEFQSLSFSTLALGPIEDIDGVILFDDLLKLTTPPGQTLRVGLINPGLPVANGVLRFQLIENLQLRLESAEWPYAGGRLSVDPTVLQLGGEVNAFNLRLSEVDLPQLITALNLQETLRATGEVTGEFPLVFTPEGGRIVGGRLAARTGGGLLALQSAAVDQTVAAGLASQQQSGAAFLGALQGMRYDELVLENVTGDLDGDIQATLRLSGENVAPVSLPFPGGKNLVGLPYRFRLTINAPLANLSRSYRNAVDYSSLIDDPAGAVIAEEKKEKEEAAPPPP